MNTVKILERRKVIQFFGLALVIAPFFNIALMFMMIKTQNQMAWSQLPYIKILLNGRITNYIVILASLIIGTIMLTGSKKAWKYTLVLIATHVVLQIPTIGQDIRQNWLWGPLFLINVSLLLFIGDQLVFKSREALEKEKAEEIKSKPKAETVIEPIQELSQPASIVAPKIMAQSQPLPKIASAPFAAKTEVVHKTKMVNKPGAYFDVPKRTFIAFDKSNWAELKKISPHGLLLRQTKQDAPVQIEFKKVEFSFDKKIYIKAFLKRREGQDYFFEFEPLTEQQSNSLNDWYERHSA